MPPLNRKPLRWGIAHAQTESICRARPSAPLTKPDWRDKPTFIEFRIAVQQHRGSISVDSRCGGFVLRVEFENDDLADAFQREFGSAVSDPTA